MLLQASGTDLLLAMGRTLFQISQLPGDRREMGSFVRIVLNQNC